MGQLTASASSVIYKLLGFTLAMVVGPIGTYYLTINTIFRGRSPGWRCLVIGGARGTLFGCAWERMAGLMGAG
jgi:hypothetical protein